MDVTWKKAGIWPRGLTRADTGTSTFIMTWACLPRDNNIKSKRGWNACNASSYSPQDVSEDAHWLAYRKTDYYIGKKCYYLLRIQRKMLACILKSTPPEQQKHQGSSAAGADCELQHQLLKQSCEGFRIFANPDARGMFAR